FGHPAGDAVISAFGDTLTRLRAPPNLVARLGCDEIPLILEEPIDVPKLCSAILTSVAEPCDFQGQMLHIGVSIGIAYAQQAGCRGEELLRKADIALYRAKADRRNCFRCFDLHMDEGIKRRTRIED